MLEHSMTETVLLNVCKQSEVLDEIWSDMSTIDPEHFQASVIIYERGYSQLQLLLLL